MSLRITETRQKQTTQRVNWTAITGISALITAAAAVVALVFAVVQIEEFREEAKIQHLLGEVNDFQSPRFTAIRKSLANERIDSEDERLKPLDPVDPPLAMYDELNFCEDLGLLTRRGALNTRDVWEEFAYWLFPVYSDARPVIDASKKDSPATYSQCTWLVEKLRPIEAKEDAATQDHPSEDDIYGFYLGEADVEPGQPLQRAKHLKKNLK